MSIKSIAAAATLALAAITSPASARLFDFRVTLDPGTPSGGTKFIQTFNSSLSQGEGSYTSFPDHIEQRRRVFGSAAAFDNALLVDLQTETGADSQFFNLFEANQLIYDNFFTKAYSFNLSWSDHRQGFVQLSDTLYRVGELVVTIDGNAETEDPTSPFANIDLDTGRGLNALLRNTNLRFSAVGTVYTYDTALEQVVSVDSISRYLGSASLVPEPTSWALMIGGFGLIGAVQRRRQVARA